jgi:protein-L-isoaspartate O-methyltransferase
MVLPIGNELSQELHVVRKTDGKPVTERVCSCVFVPLIGSEGWKERSP